MEGWKGPPLLCRAFAEAISRQSGRTQFVFQSGCRWSKSEGKSDGRIRIAHCPGWRPGLGRKSGSIERCIKKEVRAPRMPPWHHDPPRNGFPSNAANAGFCAWGSSGCPPGTRPHLDRGDGKRGIRKKGSVIPWLALGGLRGPPCSTVGR